MTYLYSRTMLFGQALKRVQGTHAGVQGVHFQGYMYHRSAPEKTLQSTKKMQWGCQNVERLTKRLLSCRVFQGTLVDEGRAQLRAQGVQMRNTRAPLYTYRGTYGTQ